MSAGVILFSLTQSAYLQPGLCINFTELRTTL